jgi:pimeloyl-ACP methyl ester carboxylesterase
VTTDHVAELPTGINLAYRTRGEPSAPPVLLTAGLGQDLTAWSDSLIGSLVAAGLYVIHYDNRDAGRSSHLEHVTPPSALRLLLAKPRKDGYRLEDMAMDAIGLLDHLGIDHAHIVGQSMGGMIAQTIAAHHPARTASLTSIYSTTGHRSVGQTAISTQLRMAQRMLRPTSSRDQAVHRHIAMTTHAAGTAYPIDVAEETAFGERLWDRLGGNGIAGWARQVQAILSSGDRTNDVRRIAAPTLVIHGNRDVVVAPSGGRATAADIPDARYVVIPGMGHHVAPALTDQISRLLAEHIRDASPRHSL